MKRLAIFVLIIAWGASAVAQNCRQSSARAIFLGEKGAIAPCAAPAKTPVTPAAGNKGAGTIGGSTAQTISTPPTATLVVDKRISANAAAMTAIKYWIELITPSGEMQRVTRERVFKSGEKIRLHLESNVSGRLTIALQTSNGPVTVLFPDRAINSGDDWITAKKEAIVPSSGYFKFDNETGIEHLFVRLTPGPAEPATKVLLAGVLNAEQVAELSGSIKASSSRGITFENEKNDSAQYIAGPGVLAMQIDLVHR